MGVVGKPHGLDGSFVVERPSEDAERFAPGAVLRGGRPGSAGRGAQALRRPPRHPARPARPARNARSRSPAASLPEPDPGSYYVFQLVGLEVEEEGGRRLGVVTDVAPGPANDALELDTGLLLPLVEACVREVDLEGKRILVAPGFAPDN